jgi:hypothetical protein
VDRSSCGGPAQVWLYPFADQILKFERNLSPSQRARLRTGRPASTHSDLMSETEMRENPYFIIALQEAEAEAPKAPA